MLVGNLLVKGWVGISVVAGWRDGGGIISLSEELGRRRLRLSLLSPVSSHDRGSSHTTISRLSSTSFSIEGPGNIQTFFYIYPLSLSPLFSFDRGSTYTTIFRLSRLSCLSREGIQYMHNFVSSLHHPHGPPLPPACPEKETQAQIWGNTGTDTRTHRHTETNKDINSNT